MPRKPSAKSLEATAYHEAGHAVAHCLLHLKFKYVTIVPQPEENTLGHLRFRRPKWVRDALEYGNHPRLRDWAENHILASLAGPMAEEIVRARRNHIGASGDYAQCADLALALYGTGELASAYMKWMGLQAKGLVKSRNWQTAIPAVAKELLTRQCLTQDEVRSIIQEAIFRAAGCYDQEWVFTQVETEGAPGVDLET